MRFTEEQYAEYLKKTNYRAALSPADLESAVSNEPMAKGKSSPCNPRASIHVHSRTNRLADPDGRSIKAMLDGLCRAGILRDDNADCIREIRQTQEKCKGDEETTVIITWE